MASESRRRWRTCSYCEHVEPPGALLCLECGEVLEDATWLRFVVGTLVVAAVLEGVFHFVGHHTFSFYELFIHGAVLMAFAYPAGKLVQWLREPGRPVVAEMLSVFSDRGMRVCVILVIAVVLTSFLGVVPVDMMPSSPWPLPVLVFRKVVCVAVAMIIALGMVWQQGVTAFDLRIKNPLIARERARRSS